MTVINIPGLKGGTGKSTTTLTIAGELSALMCNFLVIDADSKETVAEPR